MKNSTIPFNLPLFVLLTLFTALFYFQASAQTPVLQLTPSNFNGYNISCFGSTTGSINLTITGGTPPYTIEWSNASTTEDLSNLPAGYYRVSVDDADTLTDIVEAEITLTQPEPLAISDLQPHIYPNNYNVSQFGACNGNIQANVTGGVTPYSFAWSPGQQTIANPTNLCSRQNTVVITDANGCETNASANISEPERDDWTMTGNYNTNPSTQFIGTKDSIRFTIKTNDQDRLSIAANGQLRISNLAGIGSRTLMADSVGKIIASPALPWFLSGNTVGINDYIGTNNSASLIFKTNNAEVLRLTETGKVGIGTNSPSYKFHVVHDPSSGSGGIMVESISSTNSNSEIKFVHNGTSKWAIGSNLQHNSTSRNFFIYDNEAYSNSGATRFYIDADGRIGIGMIPPSSWSTDVQYKLYVADGITTRDIMVTNNSWPDYVFEENYPIMTIREYGQFFVKHKHLPGIPTAAEIEEQKGFELGAVQVILLEKVEEQAIYIVDLQNQIDELKKMIGEIRSNSGRVRK